MSKKKSSEDYWRKREEKWLKKCLAQEKDWNKEINQVYKDMLDEIEEQVSVWYQKYADGNGMTISEAKTYLSQTDIDYYAKKAKRYCELAQKDRDEGSNKRAKEYFSKQANQEMKRYNTTMKINRLEMIKSQIMLRIMNAQTNVEILIEKDLIERAQDEFKRQAGLLGKTVFNNYKDAEIIAKASFKGARFSTRIWGTHQVKLRKALNRALENSLILGKNVSAVIGEFKKITNSSIKNAQRLLATEVCRVQIEAQKKSFEGAGFRFFTFLANSGCCPHCQEKDGEHFEVDKMMAGTNAPPMHPRCRCYVSPYLPRTDDEEDFDEKAFDEWSETFDKHGLSWDDWRRKQRGESDKEKLTIDDFSKISNRVLSEKEKAEFIEPLNRVGGNIAQAYKNVVGYLRTITKESKRGYYSHSDKSLVFSFEHHRLDKKINKYSTLYHELGHAISYNLDFRGATYTETKGLTDKSILGGYLGHAYVGERGSNSDEFLEAVRKDKEILAKRRKEEGFYSFVKDNLSSGIQDALCGFFNDRNIRWGHSNGYYNSVYTAIKKLKHHGELREFYQSLGISCKKYSEVEDICRIYFTASEIWANMSSAVVCGGDSLDYFKEYLPNSYEKFIELMERVELDD